MLPKQKMIPWKMGVDVKNTLCCKYISYQVSLNSKYLSKDKNDDISKIALKYVVLLVLLELMIFETWSAPTKLIRKNPSFSSWHWIDIFTAFLVVPPPQTLPHSDIKFWKMGIGHQKCRISKKISISEKKMSWDQNNMTQLVNVKPLNYMIIFVN